MSELMMMVILMMIMILSPRHTYIYTCTCNNVYCIQYTSSQAQAPVQCVHPNPQASADKHTCTEEMHLPTTNAHQHTFSQKHKKEHTVTQSAMILDRSNYSVNFNVRLTKNFFLAIYFCLFFVFLLLCYSGHTHLVFSSGEVNWGLELLEKGCLKLLNVL